MVTDKKHKTFSELYAQVLDNYADNEAIFDYCKSLTYAELDKVSGNIACYLKKAKVGKGDIVGIYSGRSIEFVASVLAVFRLGAAYVAIDTSYPQSRVNYIMDDCDISVVLATPAAGDLSFSNAGVFTVEIDKLNDSYNSLKLNDNTKSLAYLIYTSGSTGMPKAAMVRYENFLNMVCWQKDFYDISENDKTSWISRPGFDASLFEIWSYLLSGASIHIPSEELLYEPERLLEWVKDKAITICFMPTPLVESCLDEKWPENMSLRYLFCGGDALRKRPKPGMKFRMFDHYGPSECTIVTSVAEILPGGDEELSFSNIGKGIDGMQMRVLDDDLSEIEEGQVGEICISGLGVGSGYLNNKDLTNEKFLPDPYSEDNKAKIYRSGDLGVMLANGTIEFHGRLDRQVKIRGHRIELGEIENFLIVHPDVENVAVVASEGGSTQKKIVVFLVNSSKGNDDFVANMKKYLSGKIAAYMMPTQFVELPELPMSINGKIDRLALSKFTSGQLETASITPTKATNETEANILDIFRDVLGKNSNIGVDDDFFEFGGDSLKAGKIVGRIRKEFRIAFTIHDFFAGSSVAEIAAKIKVSAKTKSSIASITDIEHGEELPVTMSQMHMLLLNDMQGNDPVCNISSVMDIDGFIDKTTLEKALVKLVKRQDVLRSNFSLSADGYQMLVDTEISCNLEYQDMIRVRAENKQERLAKIIHSHSHTRFDILQAPLCRFMLIRVEDMRFKLISIFHHAISDGWSMGIFTRELVAIYESLARSTELKLPELKVQYGDYAIWFNEWCKSKSAKSQLKYWENYLRDGTFSLDLKCTNPRKKIQSFSGARKHFKLSKKLTEQLEALCKEHCSTMYMLLLSAYATMLHHYSDQNALIVGSPIANRIVPEVENVMGLFMNSIAIKFDFEANKTFLDTLKATKDASLKAFANQNVPFEMVVDQVKPERDGSRHPIFQHLFIYQNAHISQADISGLKIRFDEVGSDTAKLDLTLDAQKRDDAIEGWFEYNTDLFNADVIEMMTETLIETLEKICENPEAVKEPVVDFQIEVEAFEPTEPVASETIEEDSSVSVEALLTDDEISVPEKMSLDTDESSQLENVSLQTIENQYDGEVYKFIIPDDIYTRLKKLETESSYNLFVMTLSAYVALLYEYSGQGSIAVGTHLANSQGISSNEVADLRTTDVALDFDLKSKMSLLDLLEESKQILLQASGCENLSQLVYQHTLRNGYNDIQEKEFSEAPKLDLVAHISEIDSGATVLFEYNSGIVTEDAVELMSEHYVDLLELLIIDSSRDIDELPFFEQSLPQIAESLNEEAEYFMSFMDMFDKQVDSNPDAVAIKGQYNTLNYGELNHITNILASKLNEHDVSGGLVGIDCGRGVGFIVCALAILKAGAGYVTLDSEYPTQRLDFMVEDADISTVLKVGKEQTAITAKATFIDVDMKELLSCDKAAYVTPKVSGEDIAYVIYTSGSTGKPKGVAVTHQNLMHLINWQLDYYDINSNDCGSHLARPSFDTSVSEIWPYLAIGSSVAVPPENIILEPSLLLQWIEDSKVTISDMTTPLAEIMLFEDWSQESSLRVLKTGGDRLHKRPPLGLPFKFVNEYGPTECTVITTAGAIEPQDQSDKAPHIGSPITGAMVHILDDNLQKVEQGEEGEIFIAGSGVAKGYINRVDLTNEKFLPDPFSDVPDSRMYRSGDLGRYLPDGNIEFIGRSDFQVQIRGFRVELGEIENAIISSDKVREAAVITTGENGNISIKAYIVADNTDGQIPSGLSSYLKQNLPDYMVPSSFFMLEQLPLTHNGKVDRRALTYLTSQEQDEISNVDQEIASPRNHIEQVLLDIWKELLGKNDIGIYDDFFEIGGHSLLIIRMAGMLEKDGFKLRVTKIFEYSKIATLASYLKFGDSDENDGEQNELVLLRKGDNNRLPLFFIHTVEGDMLFYSNLIGCMDKSQPCYGILDRGIFDASKKIEKIEDMAEHYVDIMLELQPEGPYMLVGYCFAGFIAFEIARKLRAMGKKVALLGLIETPVTKVSLSYLPYYAARAKHILNFLPIKFKEMVKKESRLLDPYEIDDGFIFDVWEGVSNDSKALGNMRKTHKINMDSTDKYVFNPYDSDAVLYIAKKRCMWRSRGKDLGWASITRKTDIVEVDSLHKDISMPPYIETIATDIRARINDITQGV